MLSLLQNAHQAHDDAASSTNCQQRSNVDAQHLRTHQRCCNICQPAAHTAGDSRTQHGCFGGYHFNKLDARLCLEVVAPKRHIPLPRTLLIPAVALLMH
jgi:hypothetical protein